MGITKTDIYTADQNEIATIAKVLGHPARIAIIQHLIKVNTCICGDLVSEIGLAQPTISQHLKELKKTGIIKGNVKGTSVCYCLDQSVIQKLEGLFVSLFSAMRNKTGNCC